MNRRIPAEIRGGKLASLVDMFLTTGAASLWWEVNELICNFFDLLMTSCSLTAVVRLM